MFIYCIENIKNGKCYVGQTTRRFGDRKSKHIYKLKNNKHSNSYLQNSWNKYGEENFRFFVLENGLKTIKELNKAEIKWIKELNTVNRKLGYNILLGGENQKHNDETKIKLSKPVAQYDLKGNLLNTYDSITEAAGNVGCSLNNIVTCLKGITKTAYNFQWLYIDDGVDEKIPAIKSRIERKQNKGDSKITQQYDLSGNLVAEYPSAAEAGRKLDINDEGIRACCQGRYKTSGGYQWKYKGTDKEIKNMDGYVTPSNKKKPVIKLNEMGIVMGEWDSVNKASVETGFSRPFISEKCKDNNDYIWNFEEFSLN